MIRFLPMLFLCFSLVNANAADSSTKNTNLFLSFHGDPPPAYLGLNAGINFSRFRFSVGAGTYNNGVSNVPKAFLNYTIVPILYPIAWLFDTLGTAITQFKVRNHLKYSHFKYKYDSVDSIFSYGGQFKIIPFNWRFSPNAGIGLAHFETNNNPFGLPNSKTHVYYSIGVETNTTLHIAAGYNFCPAIQNIASGLYVNLGAAF